MPQKPKVLVVDDEPEIGGLLKLFLEDDFEVIAFTDPREACHEVSKASYDLVVSDIKMPYLSGLDVVRFVKDASPETKVVLITGHAQTDQDRITAVELGASGILFKPFGDPFKVVAYLKGIIGSKYLTLKDDELSKGLSGEARPSTLKAKPRILVIDDEPELVEVVALLLSDDFEVTTFTNPIDALAAARNGGFDCFITDLSMPLMRGKEFIGKLRAMNPKTPIIIMSGHSAEDIEVQEALANGANGLLPKPFPDPNDIYSLIGKYLK